MYVGKSGSDSDIGRGMTGSWASGVSESESGPDSSAGKGEGRRRGDGTWW